MRRLFVPGLPRSMPAMAASTGYHPLNDIKVGGEGGWDCLTVDSAAHRFYVSQATHVVVIGTGMLKVIGDIPDSRSTRPHTRFICPRRGRHPHKAPAGDVSRGSFRVLVIGKSSPEMTSGNRHCAD